MIYLYYYWCTPLHILHISTIHISICIMHVAHPHTYSHIRTRTHTHTRTHPHTYAHIRTRTHIHTYASTHIFTRTHTRYVCIANCLFTIYLYMNNLIQMVMCIIFDYCLFIYIYIYIYIYHIYHTYTLGHTRIHINPNIYSRIPRNIRL